MVEGLVSLEFNGRDAAPLAVGRWEDMGLTHEGVRCTVITIVLVGVRIVVAKDLYTTKPPVI